MAALGTSMSQKRDFGTTGLGRGCSAWIRGERAHAMRLFYFDLCVNGQPIPDLDGVRLAELSDPRLEAAVALAEMLVDAISQSDSHSMDITIRDEARKPLARVSASIKTEELS
jgi:hypothetical protein